MIATVYHPRRQSPAVSCSPTNEDSPSTPFNIASALEEARPRIERLMTPNGFLAMTIDDGSAWAVGDSHRFGEMMLIAARTVTAFGTRPELLRIELHSPVPSPKVFFGAMPRNRRWSLVRLIADGVPKSRSGITRHMGRSLGVFRTLLRELRGQAMATVTSGLGFQLDIYLPVHEPEH